MTRDRKSDSESGGSGTAAGKAGARKIPAAKSPATKSPAAKSPAAKSPAAKSPAAKSPAAKSPAAKSPAAKSPVAATPVTKPAAIWKTSAGRSGVSAGTGPNGGHGCKDDSAGNGKGKTARPPAGRKAKKRSAARLAAVQALYQMDITGAGLNEILAQFESHWLGREVEGEQYLPAEAAFFRDIVSGVVDVQRDLDPRIDAALEATWPLKRIEAILRSVLRAGAYELQRRTDIPARVVVSEYVDVAHAFVDNTETGMVNAVLERLARNARAAEFR
jgi:transcription antitermination protein NusB